MNLEYELRRGNLVRYNGFLMIVDSIIGPRPNENPIYSDKILLDLFDGAGFITCTIDDVKPVRITTKRLLELGFDKYHEELTTKLGHRYFLSFHTVSNLVFTENTNTEEDSKVYHDRINSIHQLQNLFLDLTGEVLNLKK